MWITGKDMHRAFLLGLGLSWTKLTLFLWGLCEKVGKPEVDQFYSNLKRQPPLSFSFPLDRTEFKMWVLGKRAQETVPFGFKTVP